MWATGRKLRLKFVLEKQTNKNVHIYIKYKSSTIFTVYNSCTEFSQADVSRNFTNHKKSSKFVVEY